MLLGATKGTLAGSCAPMTSHDDAMNIVRSIDLSHQLFLALVIWLTASVAVQWHNSSGASRKIIEFNHADNLKNRKPPSGNAVLHEA